MESKLYRLTEDGLEVSVKAAPKAKQNKVVGFTPQGLKIQITAVPENGKANEAIIALLARHCGIAKQNIHFLAGETSGHKRILIQGNGAELLALLQRE